MRAASRSSPLAKWQTARVGHLLQRVFPELPFTIIFVDTLGDRTQALGTPLHQIGGQGVFVKEVQAAVLEGHADFAVHCAKDLPSSPTPGLMLIAVPERADVRDVLVGKSLTNIANGGSIATGSVRRRALLASIRPDIVFHELRGNISTRLEKSKGFDAIVMAMAPLQRLGLTEHIAEILSPKQMLPMIGQGAIAVECRTDDDRTIEVLRRINDPHAFTALTAERAFLAELGTGCDLPVAALATPQETIGGETGSNPTGFCLDALIAAADGSKVIRVELNGFDPVALGQLVAAEILRLGGGELLQQH
jgi:hydroxymethylbilane synthase